MSCSRAIFSGVWLCFSYGINTFRFLLTFTKGGTSFSADVTHALLGFYREGSLYASFHFV